MKHSKISSSQKADPRHIRARRRTIAAVLLLCVCLFACLLYWQGTREQKNGIAIDRKLLESLKQQSNDATLPIHLAAGLLPPTNRWFSGIVFTETPNPIFPHPLSFVPDSNGFTMGLPTVKAEQNTIYGSHNPAVDVRGSADTYLVSRYDAVSVTLTYSRDAAPIADVTIAEGSPFVSYMARQDDDLTIQAVFTKISTDIYTATIGGKIYGLRTTAEVKNDQNNSKISIRSGESLVVFPVAKDSTVEAMSAFATDPLQSVAVEHTRSADTIKTTFSYTTKTGSPTLYAALPTHVVTKGKKFAGSYDTIYGHLKLFSGTNFAFDVPAINPDDSLDVSKLDTASKQAVIKTLKEDVASSQLIKVDSYFGGKELYRVANLYQIALQLNQTELAATLHDQLTEAFDQWFVPNGFTTRQNRYFYYDTALKGLVAAQPSFGSELFNDHHFHYGYFLYAAAIIASHDSEFKNKHAAFLNLLASDIAAPDASEFFPETRLFDPYFGHGWASGNGAFADGNNQESSSEAVNAWNGAALWGKVSGNTALQSTAEWMLSREAKSAKDMWLSIPTSEAPFKDGYVRKIVSLNWGGKRDYATFFSAEPSAILGIQLIPLNPSMQSYLSSQKNSIAGQLVEATGGSYTKQFADYLLMYRSLIDAPGALLEANKLPNELIDDANSRTYMLSWILTRK